MKQEYQDFIEKLFEIIEPINKDLLDKCEIYDDSDRLGLVWRGDYISIVIYYYDEYDKVKYDLYINGFGLNSISLHLNVDTDSNTLKYYFTQFNLLENITIDSLNEYTIDILARIYQNSLVGPHDEKEYYYPQYKSYKDALTFIMTKHNERRTNNI